MENNIENNEQLKAIKVLIDEMTENRCVSFLWFLKNNQDLFNKFVDSKLCAMDVFYDFECSENKEQ